MSGIPLPPDLEASLDSVDGEADSPVAHASEATSKQQASNTGTRLGLFFVFVFCFCFKAVQTKAWGLVVQVSQQRG